MTFTPVSIKKLRFWKVEKRGDCYLGVVYFNETKNWSFLPANDVGLGGVRLHLYSDDLFEIGEFVLKLEKERLKG